jgi:hypothetical protein
MIHKVKFILKIIFYSSKTVANYCYLGMVLKFNGNFNLAINTLMEKARKVYFKIKKTTGSVLSLFRSSTKLFIK